MAQNCQACGREIAPGRFCPYCGTPIAAPAPPPLPSPPPILPGPPGAIPPPGAPYPGAPQYAPSMPPPVPKYKGTRKSGLARVCGLAGAVLSGGAVAGSLMPWVVVTGLGISLSGWEKDGRITVFVAGVALVFFMVGLITIARWPFAVAGLASAGCLVVFMIDTFDVSRMTSAYASIGVGLWIGVGCSAAMVIVALIGILAPRKSKL